MNGSPVDLFVIERTERTIAVMPVLEAESQVARDRALRQVRRHVGRFGMRVQSGVAVWRIMPKAK